MTLTTLPVGPSTANHRPEPPPPVRRRKRTPVVNDPARGWAVVEVRGDGTLGRLALVMATGPLEAARMSQTPAPDEASFIGLSPVVQAHLGQLHAANGRLHEAARALARGLRSSTTSPTRGECAGQLALLEAYQGQLHRAEEHAGLVLKPGRAAGGAGAVHALIAKAWVHLARAELTESRRCLAQIERPPEPEQEPWPAMAHLLLEAQLLMATRHPDAAGRLLAGASEDRSTLEDTEWISSLLVTARAEALLAAGEPQRALAALTPLPAAAIAEASVAAAAARREVGDVRGAGAVLSTGAAELERHPLALQIRAWLLEARLATDRGNNDRATTLVDRVLRSAAAEEMRAPVLDDWLWLRGYVDREPTLKRVHRDFLHGLRAFDSAQPRPAWRAADAHAMLGATLTEREREVLDLLAQMYSTEEIAEALYVSANTVKTHLKGIFGKLCVNRRVDAVRRGRQLGLC